MKQGLDPVVTAEFLRALAHPMRLRILARLLEGELSVGGFESELGLKQPNLSQQLAQLRDARLVTTRREAKSVFYRLVDDRVGVILDALQTLHSGGTAALTEAGAGSPKKRLQGGAPRAPAGGGDEAGRFATAGWDVVKSV